jgi:hypothetical protein
MTMNQVWLVVSHMVQLVLKPPCASIMKTICPSDSFNLQKSSHAVSVLFIMFVVWDFVKFLLLFFCVFLSFLVVISGLLLVLCYIWE